MDCFFGHSGHRLLDWMGHWPDRLIRESSAALLMRILIRLSGTNSYGYEFDNLSHPYFFKKALKCLIVSIIPSSFDILFQLHIDSRVTRLFTAIPFCSQLAEVDYDCWEAIVGWSRYKCRNLFFECCDTLVIRRLYISGLVYNLSSCQNNHFSLMSYPQPPCNNRNIY